MMDEFTRLKYASDLPKKVLIHFDSPDQVDRLSEMSILPHFRLINPETNKCRYLYDTQSVIHFLSNNCLSEIEGKRLTVLSFTGRDSLPFDEVPDELKGIDNKVYFIPLEHILTPSGICFLYNDDEMVYIGQSQNVGMRVATHLHERIKIFNRIYFIRVDTASLDDVEKKLIKIFKPKYNIRSK